MDARTCEAGCGELINEYWAMVEWWLQGENIRTMRKKLQCHYPAWISFEVTQGWTWVSRVRHQHLAAWAMALAEILINDTEMDLWETLQICEQNWNGIG